MNELKNNTGLITEEYEEERTLRIKYQRALEEIECVAADSQQAARYMQNIARIVLNECD